MVMIDHFGGEERESALYLRVRALEGRILSDEAVKELPKVSKSNPYYQEWLWRRRAFARFQAHLSRCFQGPKVRVLDLGCGNGWMSRRLADDLRFEVLGIERNAMELAQASRLFSRENLLFSGADVLADGLGAQKFDVIVLAAVAQYFPDLKRLLQTLRGHLQPGGEVHLLDTKFYANEKEQRAARVRSAAYYAQIGVPEMADAYYHHPISILREFGARNMNKHLTIKFLQKIKWLSPLDWYVLG